MKAAAKKYDLSDKKKVARSDFILTEAEIKVLVLVSRAGTNKEIARKLGLSPATVKRHLENILRKLSLRNRVEAAIYGLLINGCPWGISANCPLRVWHLEKYNDARPWAE